MNVTGVTTPVKAALWAGDTHEGGRIYQMVGRVQCAPIPGIGNIYWKIQCLKLRSALQPIGRILYNAYIKC